MKDFESLSTEEQTNVIMSIGAKLDKQEMWYWMGLVHLLREQDKRINKAIEYIENVYPNSEKLRSMFLCEDYISNYGAIELLEILKGSDKE